MSAAPAASACPARRRRAAERVRLFRGAGRARRVITPTHPGFAGRPRPDWFDSVADLAHAYLELLERLDLRNVTVIGFSIGGWIAAELAVRDSSRLGHIVLVDAAGIQVEGQTIADVFSLSPDQLSALSFHNPAAFRVDPASLSPGQIAGRAANFQTLAVYSQKQGMADPKLRRRLGRVTIPALVIWARATAWCRRTMAAPMRGLFRRVALSSSAGRSHGAARAA